MSEMLDCLLTGHKVYIYSCYYLLKSLNELQNRYNHNEQFFAEINKMAFSVNFPTIGDGMQTIL